LLKGKKKKERLGAISRILPGSGDLIRLELGGRGPSHRGKKH